MQSEQVNELATALAKAQGMMQAAKFNKINPHFKSKYADLSAVWDAIREALSKNGLSVTQTIEPINGTGTYLRTTLRHASGQWVSSMYPLPGEGAKPQEMGSALTYGRRYSLSSLVGIAADEDDDANEAQASHKPEALKPAPKFLDFGEPRELPLGDEPEWVTFGQQMIALAATPEWPDWDEANRGNIARMETEAPKVYVRMAAAIKNAQKPAAKT